MTTAARGWTRGRRIGAVVASVMLVLGVFSFGVSAYAEVSQQFSAEPAGKLRLNAQPQPTRFFDLAPGDRRYWAVQAELLGAERGSLSLRVYGDGALIEHPRHGLTITVDGCSGVLQGNDPQKRPACSGAFNTIVNEQPLAPVSVTRDLNGGQVWDLPDILRGSDRSFLVTIAIPEAGANDRTLQGLRGDFGIGLYASGATSQTSGEAPKKEPGATPTSGLPKTGGPALALLLIACGAIGLGLVLGRVRRNDVAS